MSRSYKLTVLLGFTEDIYIANRNFASSKMFTGHVMPVLMDCNFTVDSTNALGITGLKGPYIQNVFMHTSTTAGVGNSNPQTPNTVITNPNPGAGIIVVQFQDNFSRFYSGFNSRIPTTSGSDVKIDNSAMTAGQAYVITTLGNATAAKWHAIGVPAGVTPAVGVSFIAASNGGSGNTLTSMVQTVKLTGSGISNIEIIGNPNTSISPNILAQGFGSQMIFQCFASGAGVFTGSALGTHTHSFTPAGTNANDGPPETFTGTPGTTGATSAGTPAGTISAAGLTPTAPADGTLISLSFLMSNSSVLVQGE